MSMRYQAAILTASYFPLKVPDAPTIGAATQASSTSVSVTFTAPSNVGGGAITGYTAISSGGQTASGASSPIVVSGLTTGTAYTFTVVATNAFGSGPRSASSNSITPAAIGQDAYTTEGSYSWVAPSGVTSVCVVAVGTGAGNSTYKFAGGGGGLGWKNNITVVPGNSYTVVVGASTVGAGGDSYFINTSTVKGGGGQTTSGGTYTGDGGGNGGAPGTTFGQGGGGAGGYAGNGGVGGNGVGAGSAGPGGNGSGGGGGGGSGTNWEGGGGGGVGILGQGSSGSGSTLAANLGNPSYYYGYRGQGGSGGTAAAINTNIVASGGTYGGGSADSNPGTVGAVRIIWGSGRAFPSTNTGNL